MNPSTSRHYQVESTSSSSSIEHSDIETPLDNNNVGDSVGPCAIASIVRAAVGGSSSSSGDLEQQIESYTCDGRPSDQETTTNDCNTEIRLDVNEGDTRPQTPPPPPSQNVANHHPFPTNDDSPLSTTTTGSSENNFVSFLGYRCFMVPIVFASILHDDEENRGPVVTIKTSDSATNNNNGEATTIGTTTNSRLHISTMVPIRIEVVREFTCKITKSQIWDALRVALWLAFILTILVIVSTFILGNRGADHDHHWQSQSPSASPVQP